MQATIERAIKNNHLLQVDYPDSKTGLNKVRMVAPHILGTRGSKELMVLCKEGSEWKAFKLDRITSVIELSTGFVTEQVNSSVWDSVLVEAR